MARTGRFGRQPRSAPDLTNTLVAIAREFQNQRAQNIMDAWKKGGTFEGQKATDELVLAFWREKAKGVSKDDPLYDTYSNSVTQLEYSIEESKMTARYAQGQVSDSAMAAFYMGWSRKVPKNSEFYRVLLRDAGQYMRAAKAKSEAEARRLAEERYQNAQNGTRKQKEAAGEYAIDTLRRIAQSGNAGLGIAGIIEAPGSGSDLTQFDPNDPNIMLKLISVITTSFADGAKGEETVGAPKASGQVIYHDDDGNPVTGKDIMAQFQKLDPNFRPGTPFDLKYISGLIDRQKQGLDERIARAQATGHMQDVTSLTKSKEYVSLLGRQVEAYPVQKAYQDIRSEYEAVVADPTASPAAVVKAWEKYSAELTALSKDERIASNDAMRSMLAAEAAGKTDGPTLAETFTGLGGGNFTGQSKDAAENQAGIEFMRSQIEAVESGQAVWTYGRQDANGNFVPEAGGRVIGAATPQAVEAGGVNTQVVVVPDPRGGTPLKMAVTALPIYATATDPTTGEPLKATNGQPIGYAYDLPNGGSVKTIYGFQTKSGFMFSENPPWADNLTPKGVKKDGQARLEVDFTPVVEQLLGGRDPVTGEFKGTIGLEKPQNFGNGFEVKGGTVRKPGELVFDPELVAQKSDDRDWTGGPDPASDFSSLTLASLIKDADGQAILTNLDKHPAFRSQLERDAQLFAGVEFDPKTGAAIPGTGDQTRLNSAISQMNLAKDSRDFFGFVTEASKTWQRETTGTPYIRKDEQQSSLITGGVDLSKLATDVVRGTPFEPLANIFAPGTNKVERFGGKEKDDRFVIKPVGAIKAPVVDIKTTTGSVTGPMGGPTSAQPVPTGPAQTGSTAPQGGGGSGGGGAYGYGYYDSKQAQK